MSIHPRVTPKRAERLAVRAAAPPQAVQPQPTPAVETAAAQPRSVQPATVQPATVPPAAVAAAEASFEAGLLASVQEAARRNYPQAALMMGMTGQAAVSFQYRDGSVHVLGLMQSSGSSVLDHAALTAVQNAHYPLPPPELSGHTLSKLVHVRFALDSG